MYVRSLYCKMYAQKKFEKNCENVWSVKNKYLPLHYQNK